MERREKKNKPMRRRKKKVCAFCVNKKGIDYKDVNYVRRFMSDRGKILPGRTTGCCSLHQRMVIKAIKRARQMGLVPFTLD